MGWSVSLKPPRPAKDPKNPQEGEDGFENKWADPYEHLEPCELCEEPFCSIHLVHWADCSCVGWWAEEKEGEE